MKIDKDHQLSKTHNIRIIKDNKAVGFVQWFDLETQEYYQAYEGHPGEIQPDGSYIKNNGWSYTDMGPRAAFEHTGKYDYVEFSPKTLPAHLSAEHENMHTMYQLGIKTLFELADSKDDTTNDIAARSLRKFKAMGWDGSVRDV